MCDKARLSHLTMWGHVITMTCAGAAALGFGLGWQGAIPGAICGFAAAAIYLWIREGLEALDMRRMLPPWMRG